jgi:hypothetical protein
VIDGGWVSLHHSHHHLPAHILFFIFMPVATKKISENDPFAHFLRPPVGETPEQRAERLRREAEATRISAEIDEAINRDRAAQKKDKDLIRVLLLGQSESGEF